jgi:hypothetical protein
MAASCGTSQNPFKDPIKSRSDQLNNGATASKFLIILAAEFSRLTLFLSATMVFGRGICRR